MAIGMKQTLKMQQSLVMTPQLQQAIKLLQLYRLELDTLVNKEMTENPVLEESQEQEERDKKAQTESEDRNVKEGREKIVEGEDSFDWQSYVESYNHSPPSIRVRQEEEGGYNNVMTRTTDLSSHLLWQLQMSRLSDEEEKIGMLIIGNLN